MQDGLFTIGSFSADTSKTPLPFLLVFLTNVKMINCMNDVQ